MRRLHSPTFLLLLITAIGFLLRCRAAGLDPFLHVWDEQFHAVVARHMLERPFMPMLHVDPLIPFEYTDWTNNALWLHKPPLSLWQMAIAMKLFGVSEFSARIPGIVLGTLAIPMMYRLGYWFSGQKRVGLAAALFQACSYFLLELGSGQFGMDQNDLAMNFYVIASFWAYSHYETRDHQKWRWALLTGILAGAAVLTKWLPGLLVFAAWGLNVLVDLVRSRSWKQTTPQLLYMLSAVGVCGLLFLPWQLYIFHAFPVEAAYEADMAARHLTESVEGHKGDVDFFWKTFPDYFGPLCWTIVPVGLLYFLGKNMRRWQKSQGCMLVSLLALFLFYSLIVQTKVLSHFLIVVPFGLIIIAALLDSYLQTFKNGRIVFPVATVLCAFLMLQHVQILKTHDAGKFDWKRQAANTRSYKSLHKYLGKDIKIVLNAAVYDHALVMFYNKGIDAYHYCPDEKAMQEIFRRRLPIAVFAARPGYDIPAHIHNYPGTTILPIVLQ